MGRLIISEKLLKEARLPPPCLLMMMNLPGALVLLPFAWFYEKDALTEFISQNPRAHLDLIVTQFTNASTVAYNLAGVVLLKYTSAQYFSVIANSKAVLLIIISMIVFGTSVTYINVIGMILAFIGFTGYSYCRFIGREEILHTDPPKELIAKD